MAVALILSGLMRLAEEPQSERRYCRWIQSGLVISLLSKPVVVLMLPVLFLLPETRRKLLCRWAVYAAVSLLFLLVGRLNPGGYNGIHWLNIVRVTSSLRTSPLKRVSDGNRSPAMPGALFLARYFSVGFSVARFLRCSSGFRLLAVVVMSLSPLVLAGREQRLRAAIVTVSLCILSHFLCTTGFWNTTTRRCCRCCPFCFGFGGVKACPGFVGCLLASSWFPCWSSCRLPFPFAE